MHTPQCLAHTMYSVNKYGIILEKSENRDKKGKKIPPS